MKVLKRNGSLEPVNFEKVHRRIASLCVTPEILEFQKSQRPDAYEVCKNLSELKNAEVDLITKKTFEGMYNDIPTTEIDVLSSEIAQAMCIKHPENGILASRLLASNLHKNTLELLYKLYPQHTKQYVKCNIFCLSMSTLYNNLDQN